MHDNVIRNKLKPKCSYDRCYCPVDDQQRELVQREDSDICMFNFNILIIDLFIYVFVEFVSEQPSVIKAQAGTSKLCRSEHITQPLQ